jgi:hypothetical protein
LQRNEHKNNNEPNKKDTMSNNNFWSAEIWSKINGQDGKDGSRQAGYCQPGALKEAMGLIRVAQQIFPTEVRGNDNPVPADIINLTTGIPSAGETKPVATITKSFQLDAMHIQDTAMTMAMNQVMLAAQSLALAEDALFFRGTDAELTDVNLKVRGVAGLGKGLLGKAVEINKPIPVLPANTGRKEVFVYGSATYTAVTQGISVFANVQARPFALILDPVTYADAGIPLQDSSIVTPATAIRTLIQDDGHFTMSPSLPPNTGLLVSLGGKTTQLYVGTGPVLEFEVTKEGNYFFTAKETIQFHNIDARSLIKLEFQRPA